MRCTYCHKKIKKTAITETWYHKKNNSTYCYENLKAKPLEKKW